MASYSYRSLPEVFATSADQKGFVEAGITIANESRDILFSLPSADVFENWSDYVGFAQELIDGWNKNH